MGLDSLWTKVVVLVPPQMIKICEAMICGSAYTQKLSV